MNLTDTIESAELRFKQILEDFFISNYDDKYLTSHGINHHRRVWSYAKELLPLVACRQPASILPLPSKLIIACYLHDIGMSVDPGTRHGHLSRDLCIQFLINNDLHENEYQDVLEAIENHDRKDYIGNTGVNDLLSILSVADDLDAFGFTGIFRYSEIYLTRGINPDKIGYLIKENAVKRFDNFLSTFGFAGEIVDKYKKRYEVLNNFFNDYNNQVTVYEFGTINPLGYCGVIELFIHKIKNKIDLKDLYLYSNKYLGDSVIRWYLSELASELLVEHTLL